MPHPKGSSVFVLFLLLGMLLLTLLTLLSFVPAFKCPVGLPNEPLLLNGDHIVTHWDGRVRYWTCRTCGGDTRVTLFETWIGGEDGAAPQDVELGVIDSP